MDDALFIKVLFVLCIFFSSGLVGFLPIFFSSLYRNKEAMSIANCFAAGVFIVIGVTGLLPEAQESYSKDTDNEIKLGYGTCILGYIIIFFIENVPYIDHNTNDQNISINNAELLVELNPNSAFLIERKKKKKVISSIILSAILVIHSIFEGIAIGILTDKSTVLTLCIALLIHNIPAAIALGIKMKDVDKWIYTLLMGAFALSSPLSIVIGIFLSDFKSDTVKGFFLSISAGTFIYIGCTEILPEEMRKPYKKFEKIIAFFLGIVPLGIFILFSE